MVRQEFTPASIHWNVFSMLQVVLLVQQFEDGASPQKKYYSSYWNEYCMRPIPSLLSLALKYQFLLSDL